jgi:hypothetical protein
MAEGIDGLNKRLLRNYVVVLSAFLVLLGDVIFVVTLPHLAHGSHVRDNLNMIGSTVFQVGAITLILEAVNFRRFATEEVPGALLTNDDFLRKLSPEELTAQLKRTSLAAFPHAGDIDSTIAWLSATLGAPARRNYSVDIALAVPPVLEQFADGRPSDLPPGVLCVGATISYRTDPNPYNHPLLINGDGLIHNVFTPVPEAAALTRRHRDGDLSEQDCQTWIRLVMKPELVLEIDGQREQIRLQPEIENVAVRDGRGGRLSIEFDLTCGYSLNPGERAWVTYTHRQLGNTHDAYVWTCSARTYDYAFRARGFEGFDLVPVANPASRSTVERLDLSNDEIRCVGLILPESTFAFTWSGGPDSA